MSDLISRSALLNAMDKRYKEKKDIVPNNLAEGFLQVEKLINEQPIVYDVNKVVEELVKMQGIQFDGMKESYQLDWCIETKRAIEIVKGGGVNVGMEI